MKTLILLIASAFCSSSFAYVSTAPMQKDYVFKYQLKGESLEIKRKAASYDDAFEKAAQQCFSHFKGPGKVSEDRGLDIIDVCANPRS